MTARVIGAGRLVVLAAGLAALVAPAAAQYPPPPDAQQQQQLYQQQQQTQMISNMLRMQHQTNMTIIRNMGSTPYKYEYRYVPRR